MRWQKADVPPQTLRARSIEIGHGLRLLHFPIIRRRLQGLEIRRERNKAGVDQSVAAAIEASTGVWQADSRGGWNNSTGYKGVYLGMVDNCSENGRQATGLWLRSYHKQRSVQPVMRVDDADKEEKWNKSHSAQMILININSKLS